MNSWENVFCIDEVTDCWYIPKSTQETFWELKKMGFEGGAFCFSRINII